MQTFQKKVFLHSSIIFILQKLLILIPKGYGNLDFLTQKAQSG